MVANGENSDFGRGSTAHSCYFGDPSADFSNANMGPLEQGSLDAGQFYPGDTRIWGFVAAKHAMNADNVGA
ncbi:MAG: hypothetical protein P8J20_05515 [Novosphingobium sp.]|nr:hypothetical protein [Novosphingobium sp.]